MAPMVHLVRHAQVRFLESLCEYQVAKAIIYLSGLSQPHHGKSLPSRPGAHQAR